MKNKLLPVIPLCTNGEGEIGKPAEIGTVLYLLNKYGHLLSDYAVCFVESPEMVGALIGIGKKAIPLIYSGDPKWIDWVLSNQHRFEAVSTGNTGAEVTNYNANRNLPTTHFVEQIFEQYPSLVGRLILAPWHSDVIIDMNTPGFPLLQLLKKAGPFCFIYSGFAFLDDTIPTLFANKSRWISSIRTFSGINYSEGAVNHNLKKSLDLGMEGCLFFLPARVEKEEADRLMGLYLTDVQGENVT